MKTTLSRREYMAWMLASSATLALGGRSAFAADYPSRPISLVVGYPPGGSTDVAARLVGQAMSASIPGGNIVVENRPGASGMIASSWLTRQPADGYSLMLSESASFAVMPALSQATYQPLEDFSWIATICISPMVFVVSPDFPANTIQEALKILRSTQSSDLSYASSGVGSMTHIAPEMLTSLLGPNARSLHVPYSGGAPAALSIAKGETAWGVQAVGSAAGLITGGKMRALAVTGTERFPAFPDVPTFHEAGLPEMEINVYYLVHAPSGINKNVADFLNKAIVSGINTSENRSRLLTSGMQLWESENTPGTTRATVERELSRMKQIVERTGMKV